VLRSRATFGHGSLVLGEHFNTDGTIDNTKVQDTIVVDERMSDPTFRDTRDPYHLSTGGALGSVHKGMAFYRLRGRILVPNTTQQARLSDRERQLRAAFDPALCLYDSPGTDGAYTFDWDELTTDTGNWPTGRLPQRIYARPASQPQVVEMIRDGAVRQFVIGLITPDPRIYGQTEQTLSLTPGSPSQVATNLGTVPTPWRATITMAGAGSSTFSIERTGDGLSALVLDLSGMVGSDVVVVYGETSGPYGRGRRVTKNGADNFALKTSLPDTWFTLPSGASTVVIANTTNVTSCVFAWRHAWA
jgi:hypothetical protein